MSVLSIELRPFRIAGPAAREAALVLLRDERGVTGVGEAAPIAGFSSETLPDTWRALEAVRAAPPHLEDFNVPAGEGATAGAGATAAAGATPGESAACRFAAAPSPMESIERALSPHGPLLDKAPSARFALETALLDWIARRRNQDVATTIRNAPPVLTAIETSALLHGADEGDAFVARALAALALGFRTLKVKLRATDEPTLTREIQGLTLLRAAAPDMALRLDPNGRWSIAQARHYLERLAPLQPHFVEQPVPAADLLQLGPCAVPWAADESLGIPAIAARLTPEMGCAAFILKPAALGIGRALSLARTASVPVVVTHFMDGPIGLAAACEFALSLDTPPLPCGLAPHPGLQPEHAIPRSQPLPHHTHPARIQRTSKHGLGTTLLP